MRIVCIAALSGFALVLGLAASAPAQPASGGAPAYRSVKLEDFEAAGFDLVGQQVEILGDYDSFLPISPTTVASIIDPRMSMGKKALGDPEAMRKLRGIDPRKLPKVSLDLSRTPTKTLQWFLQNQCREHCEGVYFRGEVVRHRVNQMPALALVDASRESVAAAPAPPVAAAEKTPSHDAGSDRTAALLFASGAGDLTAAEQSKIAGSLGLVLAPDGKSFVDGTCGQPASASAEIVDLNHDGRSEVFVVSGNSCTSGMAGASIVLFVKGRSGEYEPNLGFPGVAYTALASKNAGFPDLRIGGPGFCEPVWRWSGAEYEYLRNQPTAKDGCKVQDAERAAAGR